MGRLQEFDETKAIDGAVDCFWARGYEAASVRDLAQHMGIGGASLYNAYGGKRALFVAALERYANRSSRERIARLEATGQPKQAIRAFLGKVIAGYLEEIRGFFQRNIEAGRKAGQMPSDIDAAGVSAHLLGVLLGIRVMARTNPDRALLQNIVGPALTLLDLPARPGKP